jgi:hypothetical protein
MPDRPLDADADADIVRRDTLCELIASDATACPDGRCGECDACEHAAELDGCAGQDGFWSRPNW